MGTDLLPEDAARIRALATEVLELYETRDCMRAYVEARMAALAPNYTQIVGAVVGARLLAKAGSLLKLAKAPASTIQILGAEATLFKARKMHAKTPKFGFLYNCERVAGAAVRDKGRVARLVA